MSSRQIAIAGGSCAYDREQHHQRVIRVSEMSAVAAPASDKAGEVEEDAEAPAGTEQAAAPAVRPAHLFLHLAPDSWTYVSIVLSGGSV